MRVIVTGGLGYVGARVLHGDWPETERIVIDDRSVPGAVIDASWPAGIQVVDADVCVDDLQARLRPGNTVIHLAAVTGADAAASPRLMRVNVEGTARVARACAAASARLLFLSSTSVYEHCEGKVDETTDLAACPPTSAYACSKAAAERAVLDVASTAPLRFAILRCGTMYGPSPALRTHTAINKFCWQRSGGQPLTVWRTALLQRRPYLALDDAVLAIRCVCEGDLFNHEVFNVVTETLSVSDVIETMRSVAGPLDVELVDAPAANTASQDVSAARLQRAGWHGRGNLSDGIRATLDRMAIAAHAGSSHV